MFVLFSLNYISEIPHSIAAAIAQGNLNPRTMEAFDFFSNSIRTNPISAIRFHQLQKQEKQSLSSKEGCFAVITSCKSTKEGNTGKFFQHHMSAKYTSDVDILQIGHAENLPFKII